MHTQVIDYFDQNIKLEGFLAYDDKKSDQRPAVIVVHDWTGRNEFACDKAKKLAELGYVGFALDMYGNAKLGKDKEEKSQLIKPFIENRTLLQQRITVALNVVKKLDQVDSNRIAAIGFCFGGLCALDLARSGANIRGVVSFHGLLNAPKNLANKKIYAKVLALHGYDDPMGTPDAVAGFEEEMTKADADWQLHVYSNTMHGFTNPTANDPVFGTVYNSISDQRSWIAMKNFLAEIF